MAEYQRDRSKTDAAMRKSGVVVVMNKSHITEPEHMVTTMKAIYEAGYVAEVTFRIEEALLREAMVELVKIRADSPADNPFILGVGSVINPQELDAAIEMGFDMIVAPANVMGGYGEGKEGYFLPSRSCNAFLGQMQYILNRSVSCRAISKPGLAKPAATRAAAK